MIMNESIKIKKEFYKSNIKKMSVKALLKLLL